MNPFTEVEQRYAYGPGSLEMALPLVQSLGIRAGMRVLEVGAGSGQIASLLAKHWDVSVVTLEPWHGGEGVQAFAAREGVANRVLALKVYAQKMPFADATFDAVLSIGSFEMIADERPQALAEMIRVARPGVRIGIAEPMCCSDTMPEDLANVDRDGGLGFGRCFRTPQWNRDMFTEHGLRVTCATHFREAFQWWVENLAEAKASPVERDFILRDGGRWLSLGMVVGEKTA